MKDIKIIQSSDVHSYILKQNEDDNRGLLRFEKYIKKQRENYNVILIDTGDMFQGTDSFLSYYVEQNLEDYKEHPITDALNHLKYDIFTPGNHEFNYGIEYLQKSLNNFQGDIVIANIQGIEKYLKTIPYKIINIEGTKVAIIGFVTAQVPQFEKEDNIKDLNFTSILDTYAKYEQELKEQADIIVVNYHGGFSYDIETLSKPEETLNSENEAGRLINKFSSIDIVLSGHQHRQISQSVKGTYITQPGVNASHISEITIKKQTNTQLEENNNKYKITGKLISNEEESKEENIPKSIISLQKRLEHFLNTPISTSDGSLKIDDLFKARKDSHLFVDFLNQLQLQSVKADISAVNLFDTAVGFSKEITLNEALKNYPFPNTLKVLEITKEDLKEALEISASYFELDGEKLKVSDKFLYPKKHHFQYDMYYGIYYEMDIRKPVGQRITKLEFKNKVDENHIKIALNSYRATNFAWFKMYENKDVVYETQLTISEMLINYLKETPKVEQEKIETFKVIY